MVRHDCPCEASSRGSWSWAGFELQNPRLPPHERKESCMDGFRLSALSVAAAALYEQTSNGAASAAAGPRRIVRPFWFGESWHVEYHPRVISALEYSKQEGHCRNHTH